MIKKRKDVSSEKLSEVIVKGMQEKKATDIVVLDLRKVKNAVFVPATPTSNWMP